jgi:hypothetical protein
MKSSVHHTLATLHHKVFAAGAFWDSNADKNVLRLAVTRRRRQWFEGLWAQAAIDPGPHRFGHEWGRIISNGQSGIITDGKAAEAKNTEATAQKTDDIYTEFKKLKELLDYGIITQTEFDARKKKLTG